MITFQSQKISEGVTRIMAPSEELVYLVEGSESAALIDTGSGDGALNLIDGVMGVCDDIMNGNTDDVPFSFKDSKGYIAKEVDAAGKRKDGGVGNIVFRKS